MASIRLELDNEVIGALALRGPGIRAEVSSVANRIAESARGRTDDRIVVNDAGKSRARSYVARLDSGASGEAKDRALGGAIDAGRS